MLGARETAKIFSSKALNALANDDFSFISEVAVSYFSSLNDVFQIRDVFDACYKDLKKSYKAEYYIKNLIAKKILLGRHSMNTATLLGEFRVGANKADCVIVNGHTTCYEIKSSYDDMSRLPNQLESYLKIFDRVNVVTSSVHVEKVLKIAPEKVGVIQLGKKDSLAEVRAAITSTDPVDVDVLIASLRRREYSSLVEELCGYIPACSNTSIYEECRSLLRGVSSPQLRAAFCRVIKDSRRVDKEYVSALPESLLVAGIEYSISSSSRKRLVKNMNMYLSKEAVCTTQYSRQSGMS